MPPKFNVPPKPPGVHTNEEVKEALHARALRRTIVVSALVFLMLASLVVVFSRAREYTGEEDSTSNPKVIILAGAGLQPNLLDVALGSSKSPFSSLLSESGGLYMRINAEASGDAGSTVVSFLTGNRTNTATNLVGKKSFLRELKNFGFKPAIVAPGDYWSGTKSTNGVCAKVGLFDTECSAYQCPSNTPESYCNTDYKYESCGGRAELFYGDIYQAFQESLKNDADILYAQFNAFKMQYPNETEVSSKLRMLSDWNILDATLGRMALALVQRTKQERENWLIVVTSYGLNEKQQAPLIMAAYSRGELVKLKGPTQAHISDLKNTILHWFGKSPDNFDQANAVGICSTGVNVKNCKS